jgi:hypothetical protein
VTISGWNNCGNGLGTWSGWTGSGLDKHSLTSDPVFVDTQKVFRTGYLPRGDFNPTNAAMLNSLHFQTFPMDSFGVLVATGPSTSIRRADRDRVALQALAVRYSTGWLTVSFEGAYDATITTPSGRTMASFSASGDHRLALDPNRFRSGVYILSIHSGNGTESRPFLVGSSVR